MTLSLLRGQQAALSSLQAALSSGAVPHAYLFSGPDGVGKELAASGLAKALLCRQKPNEGCGECDDCGRIERRSHPDVFWVLPEEVAVSRGLLGRSDISGTPSRDIKVEQVRKLSERLSLRALEGGAKVSILVEADRLNPQAQNALLKTLEEPPPQTFIVLLTSAPDRLLPTLRSRCSPLKFRPLSNEIIAEAVKAANAAGAENAFAIAAMSGGSMGRALSWDADAFSHRKQLVADFEALRWDNLTQVVQFAETYGASREEAESAALLLLAWLADVILARAGHPPESNVDLAEEARAAAQRLPPAALHRRRQLLSEMVELLSRNGSSRMQLESACLRMLLEERAP
jgi:DNA polymerase-3 subunit delta'